MQNFNFFAEFVTCE